MKKDTWNIRFNTFKLPLIFLAVFYTVAIWRFLATGKAFYLYNFGYIGTSLALGIFLVDALPKKYSGYGRRISQLLVGIYMLGYVGFVKMENMQLEGFFFYLLGGIFAGSTLHYVIAKIFGTALFGRGWCSWACWTAMVLDFLPWKKSPGRKRKAGVFRYIHFALSLSLVLYFWFVLKQRELYNQSMMELYWLALGNSLYYILGISMAALLKDNRAFCKYLCPIPVFMKLFSGFSLLKVEIQAENCTHCGACEKNCPMDVKLLEYKEKGLRVLSKECIICTGCGDACKFDAVKYTFRMGRQSLSSKKMKGD